MLIHQPRWTTGAQLESGEEGNYGFKNEKKQIFFLKYSNKVFRPGLSFSSTSQGRRTRRQMVWRRTSTSTITQQRRRFGTTIAQPSPRLSWVLVFPESSANTTVSGVTRNDRRRSNSCSTNTINVNTATTTVAPPFELRMWRRGSAWTSEATQMKTSYPDITSLQSAVNNLTWML